MATQLMTEMEKVGEVYRQFIPTEQGLSLSEQIYPWNPVGLKQRMKEALPLHEGDPQTTLNVINMMAVEMQHWADYQAFAMWSSDGELKSLMNQFARAEHLHHMKLMSLLNVMHHPAEQVLYQEVALLTSYMCYENESNDSVKSAFRRIFMDHLEHANYAACQVGNLGCPVETITGGADLTGGTDLNQQFMKVDDVNWKGSITGAYEKSSVDPQTLVNVDMALAGEQAAWHGYHCAFSHTNDADMMAKWAAFQSIESQHLGILASLKDPTETMLERALVHERVEMQHYQMLAECESDPRVKDAFHELYREDMEQARLLAQLAK